LFRGLLFSGWIVMAVFILGEMATRHFSLDHRLLGGSLYYQGSVLELYRASDTPGLLYDLIPGKGHSGRAEFAEGSPEHLDYGDALDANRGRAYRVDITEHGTRAPAHPLAKAPGVFRILFFGPSTLLGAGVDNHETMAVYLEERLNGLLGAGRSLRGVEDEGEKPARQIARFEVWNFGRNAYNLTQDLILARREVPKFDGDLVVFLHSNEGRRAFLAGVPTKDLVAQMELDPLLWQENFDSLCGSQSFQISGLVRRSALIRWLILGFGPSDVATCPHQSDPARDRELAALTKETHANGLEMLFAAMPRPNDTGFHSSAIAPDLPQRNFLSLQQEGREDVFYLGHPTPRILKEHAERIAEELWDREFVHP
jgi:hypothetical protein